MNLRLTGPPIAWDRRQGGQILGQRICKEYANGPTTWCVIPIRIVVWHWNYLSSLIGKPSEKTFLGKWNGNWSCPNQQLNKIESIEIKPLTCLRRDDSWMVLRQKPKKQINRQVTSSGRLGTILKAWVIDEEMCRFFDETSGSGQLVSDHFPMSNHAHIDCPFKNNQSVAIYSKLLRTSINSLKVFSMVQCIWFGDRLPFWDNCILYGKRIDIMSFMNGHSTSSKNCLFADLREQLEETCETLVAQHLESRSFTGRTVAVTMPLHPSVWAWRCDCDFFFCT